MSDDRRLYLHDSTLNMRADEDGLTRTKQLLNLLCTVYFIYCKVLFLCAWECLIIKLKRFWQLKILKVAIQLKNECVARPGNASEFYFHFHIHKLEADYRRIEVGV